MERRFEEFAHPRPQRLAVSEATVDQFRARGMIILAGLLWSLSGFFAKALTVPTVIHVHEPPLAPMTIAAGRALFAGLALLPLLRLSDRPTIDRKLLGMIGCFAAMNVFFVTAMTTGAAAIAILLQYTAPVWMLLAGVYWLRESVDRRDVLMMLGGLTGVGVIVAGNWTQSNPWTIACALASGVTYAGVVLLLRAQNHLSAAWLTGMNLLGTAAILSPALILLEVPTARQVAWLAVFGMIQLALPYWLMARALRHVSSVEAGLLTLIEPVLNPLWAWWIAGESEKPTPATLVGGGLILVALAVRYWPRRT